MFGNQFKKIFFSLSVIAAIVAFFAPEYAAAQPPLPGVDDGMIVLPLGGLAVAFIAAAAYGVKKYRS